MYEWRGKDRMILCTCAGLSESVHFALVLRYIFAWHIPNNPWFILESLGYYFFRPVIDPKPSSPEDLSVKSDLKAEIAGNLSESASQLHTTSELEMDKSENAISGMEIYESDSTHIGTTELNLSTDMEHNQSNNASADFDVNLSADLEHNQSFNASGDIDVSLSADLEHNHSYNATGDFDVNEVEIGAELVVSQSETPSVIKLDYTRKYPKKKITEREKMTHLKKVLTSIPERGMYIYKYQNTVLYIIMPPPFLTHTHTHTCMHACMHAHTHTHTHTHTSVWGGHTICVGRKGSLFSHPFICSTTFQGRDV